MESLFLLITYYCPTYFNNIQLKSVEKYKIPKNDLYIMKNIKSLHNLIHFTIDHIKDYGIRRCSDRKKVKIKFEKFDSSIFLHSFIFNIIKQSYPEYINLIKKSFLITVYDNENCPLYTTYVPYEK